MNPQNPLQPPQQHVPNYDHHQRVGNELTVMQPGETHVVDIKRHPIGILGVYFGVLVVLSALAFMAFAIAPSAAGNSATTAQQVGTAVFFIVTILALLYAFVATKVYWGNTWTVTSDSVTQISQTGLFHRQSSQLSLEHIEDVVAEQHGILTHIFDYGLLKVQTAAEHSKFHFYYCPNPNFYAQKILAAREAFHAQAHAANHQVPPISNASPDATPTH